MARPFKHPQIKQLSVGETCTAYGDPKAIKRSADAYGKRNGRRYSYELGEALHWVTRLPDPEPERVS